MNRLRLIQRNAIPKVGGPPGKKLRAKNVQN